MKNLDLGLIGNSRTSALIDRQARIVWWCYPHFDSNPMCCSLLRPVPNDAAPEAFGFTDVLFPDSHTSATQPFCKHEWKTAQVI
jgi:GH15 family glucan-1,4-alpha-glucosidase